MILPAKTKLFICLQAANINDIDHFNFDDTENKPSEKKILDKLNV